MTEAAPDAASLAAGRKLAVPGPWRDTGCNDVLVWGQCQGSGKTPYQVSVDLTGPAYRCSCPSRKFPCKHAIALLMLWSEGALDESGQVASFAEEWAGQRADRAAAPTRAPEKPTDPAARAKRIEQRLARMDAGVEDFRLWLADLVRSGLAAARAQPYSFWDNAAARLVDAQVPALAERVREAGSQVHARPDWAAHLLAEVGSLVDDHLRVAGPRTARRRRDGRGQGRGRLGPGHRRGPRRRRAPGPLDRPGCPPLRRRQAPGAAHVARPCRR